MGHCQAQEIKGSVVEAVTKKGIPYVIIGIPGRSIGPVTDPNGAFDLLIPDKYAGDTLRDQPLQNQSLPRGANGNLFYGFSIESGEYQLKLAIKGWHRFNY